VNYGHITDTVQIGSWEDCLNVLNEDLSPYKTLVIDTAGKMLDFMSEDIIRKNPKLGKKNGALTLQGFGERKGEFRQFCKRVMMMNKHLVFVAHRDTQRNNEEIRYVPLFGGSSYDDLVTDLDLVGYLEAVGRTRTLTFDPSDRNDGKNTCNLPAQMSLPMVVDGEGNALENTFLADAVMKPYIANLERRKQQESDYKALIDEIRKQVHLTTDALSLNDLIGRMDKFEHTGNSRQAAKDMITAKAKLLNLKFNGQTKKYEQAV
jgi:hypothetical protein